MDRCPSCQARFKGDATCYRCGADLSLLLRVENQSKELMSEALRCYQRGDHSGARNNLRTALQQDSTPSIKPFADFLSDKLKNPVIKLVGNQTDSATLQLTQVIMDSVREVHAMIGGGLKLRAYKECLSRELSLRKISFKRDHPVPVEYKGLKLSAGAYLDFLVEGQIAVVISSSISDEKWLANWIELGGWTAGLLIEFDVSNL